MAEKDRDWYWQNLKNPGQPGEPPRRKPRQLRRALRHLAELALLVALALGAWALWQNPASHQWGEARWHALLGRLGLERPADNTAAQPTKYGDSPRSMAECIKPGNLIDDEVRACVKGYRVKTW
ncbi:hypothetical protein [Pseudomonas citronellolis]|uniref:hypothetical protein n=1 Tax=Pseudomonas citronellolis TaxID=53408 RepID=UPI0023E3BAF4|nr:hypothetical protein [Pseudomonas citronellolis]MDF3931829.1 hypothetical protein [Pseudomonas citronellolis]